MTDEFSTTDSNASLKTETDIFSTSETCITRRLQDISADLIAIQSLDESISRLSTSPTGRNALNQMIHPNVSPSSPNSSIPNITGVVRQAGQISDQPQPRIDVKQYGAAGSGIMIDERFTSNLLIQKAMELGPRKDNIRQQQFNALPRSVKMYQLLSTQSEDRTDGEIHLADRRISLQISKPDEATQSLISSAGSNNVSVLETRSISMRSSSDIGIRTLASADVSDDSPLRKISSPGDVGTSQRFLGDTSNVTVRPIYPYCPYSPYGSPQGSPRNKRRPLRESRRVSIDNRQGALQLNQYKLLDIIGQVS